MNSKERKFITAILSVIIFITIADLISDHNEGAKWWHLFAEACVATGSAAGILFLMKDSFSMKHTLEEQRLTNVELKREAEKWREQSRKFLQGLSSAIDHQLSDWKLTASEKEVAFLLLKGLSLKEIASARNTSEKTARAQSIAVYSKAGVSGRSELSAFFLEDLLVPAE
jgi:DNA-binding CsgD family transcriptional regulator